MQPVCLIHHIKAHISKSDIDFLDDHYVGAYFSQLMMDFESWPSPREDYTSFFTLEHEAWLTYFSWCTLCRDIFLNQWCILGHSHSLEVIIFSFHIGVQDMTGWFPWCDYRSIAFSSLLIDFFFLEMIGSWHRHLWELATDFSHFKCCPILGHNPFIGNWS